jgi:uncharacterized membrane protein
MNERLRGIALFSSLCLFLSLLELMIPKPIPFLRIGLANLPILLSLTVFSSGEVLLIILLKVFGQGLISGTLLSYVFLFSAAGSFAGGLVMLGLGRLLGNRISLIGLGVMGALTSNIVQLGISRILIFGESTRLIAPPFLLLGTLTGFILGAAAEAARMKSLWFSEMKRRLAINAAAGESGSPDPFADTGSSRLEKLFLFRFFVGAAMLPPFFFHADPLLRALQLLLCLAASLSAGRKFRPLPGLIVLSAVLFAHILMPVGEVMLRIFDFPLTRGAIDLGLEKGLSIVALVYLSRFAVSKELQLPGLPGRLLYTVLSYFEELTAFRPKSPGGGKLTGVVAELDRALLRVSFSSPDGRSAGPKNMQGKRGKICSFFLPLFILALHWLLFFQFLY